MEVYLEFFIFLYKIYMLTCPGYEESYGYKYQPRFGSGYDQVFSLRYLPLMPVDNAIILKLLQYIYGKYEGHKVIMSIYFFKNNFFKFF